MRDPDQSIEAAQLETARAEAEAHPTDAGPMYRLGEMCFAAGEPEAAVRAFAKAAQLKPDWADPQVGLGAALASLNQTDAAITAYRSALSIDDKNGEVHFALARQLAHRGAATEAVEHYEAASTCRPNWPEPYLYRGALHEARGEYQAAYNAYDQALALGAPAGFALRRDLQVPIVADSAKIYADARNTYFERLTALLENPPHITDPIREAGGNRFFLAYHGLDDRPFQEGLVKLFAKACPSLAWTAPHCRERQPIGTKRRIGIVSRFLHDHSIGRLLIDLLTHLYVRPNCEIFLYHAVAPRDDELRREIDAKAHHVTTLPTNLQSSREIIAEARLDIMFYPDIGMDPVTYFLAQARLATVQCVTWGHPVTTGMPTIDYYLTCDAAEPDDAESHYSETLVRLSGLPSSYRRPPRPDPIGTRADFDLSDDSTIYFLAQNLFKIHPDMDAPLAKILREDPNGIILLPDGQDVNWTQSLRARFERSIDRHLDRIRFLPRVPHEDFMRLLALSDVSLDSFPFSGGNTTYQSLAMGTPVVTLPGKYLRGRLSLGIYRNMKLLDCVAADTDDYARIALRLGMDATFRESIRARIDETSDAIFEDKGFLVDAQNFLMTVQPPPQTRT